MSETEADRLVAEAKKLVPVLKKQTVDEEGDFGNVYEQWHEPSRNAAKIIEQLLTAYEAERAAHAETKAELASADAALIKWLSLADEAQRLWDADTEPRVKAGKLLMAMISPKLRYRADISEHWPAIEAARARVALRQTEKGQKDV